jgi:hypothetical protein
MYAKLENPLSVRNVAFGLLLAASLILPTLAHGHSCTARLRDGYGVNLKTVPNCEPPP